MSQNDLFPGQARDLCLMTASSLRMRSAGQLTAVDATVWLTLDGHPGDHVLKPGQSLSVLAGQRWVAEPWKRDAPVRLRWQPALAERAGWRRLRAAWFSAPAGPACDQPAGRRAVPAG